MQSLEQTKQGAAGLHWLATLLTGDPELAIEVTIDAVEPPDHPIEFFSSYREGWSRRLVIAKAISRIRDRLTDSAKRRSWAQDVNSAVRPQAWRLDAGVTKAELEQALLSIDIFPRAAVLLLLFEGLPIVDATALLDADAPLVRSALAAGVRELVVRLAGMRPRDQKLTA